MLHPARLVLVGGLAVDLVQQVDELPRRGEDVRARRSYAEVGGAFRTLASARRHGLPAAYAGRYGNGPFGTAVATALAAEDVTALLPRDDAADSGFRSTVVEPGGAHLSVVTPGVDAHLDQAHLAGVPVRQDDAVYVTGSDLVAAGTGAAVASWLKGLPARTLLVFAPGRWLDEIPWQTQERVLRRCGLLAMSAAAVRQLVGTGRPGAAWRALQEYAPRLTAAVVRQGLDGCWVGTQDEPPVEVPAPPVDAPEGPAADAVHTGVLLAGLARGLPAERAALRANVAVALRTTGPGAPPCPTPAAVDHFLTARWT